MGGDDEREDLNMEEAVEGMIQKAAGVLLRAKAPEEIARAYLRFHTPDVIAEVMDGNLDHVRHLDE